MNVESHNVYTIVNPAELMRDTHIMVAGPTDQCKGVFKSLHADVYDGNMSWYITILHYEEDGGHEIMYDAECVTLYQLTVETPISKMLAEAALI